MQMTPQNTPSMTRTPQRRHARALALCLALWLAAWALTPQAHGDDGAGDAAAVRATVQAHKAEVQACYEGALTQTPGLQGRLVVALSISASGQVISAEVAADSTAQHPALEACVLSAVRGWLFPPRPGADTLQVRYPFELRAAP